MTKSIGSTSETGLSGASVAENRPPALPWSMALQEEWVRKQGPHSSELLEYLGEKRAKYACFIFVSYLYSPICFGIRLVPKSKVLFVPTLHDEPPAYLSIFRHTARQASRLLWNTAVEKEITERLWGQFPGEIVSMGIETTIASNEKIQNNRMIKNLKKEGRFPEYLLYCGRIDPGKGCAELFEYFMKYKKRRGGRLQLVLTGNRTMKIPGKNDIYFAGFVSEEEKRELMAGALAFVMPSPLESLSLVTLEAMSQETPVLVNGQNPVLFEHINQSQGGRYYDGYETFESELSNLIADEKTRKELGVRGRKYVLENFSRHVIRERLLSIVKRNIEHS